MKEMKRRARCDFVGIYLIHIPPRRGSTGQECALSHIHCPSFPLGTHAPPFPSQRAHTWMAQGRKLYTTLMESTARAYSAGTGAAPCCPHPGLITKAAGPAHTCGLRFTLLLLPVLYVMLMSQVAR